MLNTTLNLFQTIKHAINITNAHFVQLFFQNSVSSSLYWNSCTSRQRDSLCAEIQVHCVPKNTWCGKQNISWQQDIQTYNFSSGVEMNRVWVMVCMTTVSALILTWYLSEQRVLTQYHHLTSDQPTQCRCRLTWTSLTCCGHIDNKLSIPHGAATTLNIQKPLNPTEWSGSIWWGYE